MCGPRFLSRERDVSPPINWLHGASDIISFGGFSSSMRLGTVFTSDGEFNLCMYGNCYFDYSYEMVVQSHLEGGFWFSILVGSKFPVMIFFFDLTMSGSASEIVL